jgi:hypothetical protein
MIPAPASATVYRGFTYTPNNAVSSEAQQVVDAWRRMLQALANVASLRPRLSAIAELDEVYSQCANENWDGEGAAAITQATYIEALKFLSLLPLIIATPEIVPEPNGSIGFEWHRNQQVFVVSVKGRQTLSYAGVFNGGVRPHGTIDFIDSIPPAIIASLQRLREG